MKNSASLFKQILLFSCLLTAYSAAADFPPECRTPKSNTCDFYRKCMEVKYQCGDSGYPIGYGEKYCQRFSNLSKGDLSAKGIVWRDTARLCLQNTLAPLLYTSTNVQTCDQLKSVAFESHVPCYTAKGNSICGLGVGDWTAICGTIDPRDVLSKDGLTQIVGVIKTCKDNLLVTRSIVLNELHGRLPIVLLSKPVPLSESKSQLENHLREVDDKINFIESLP